MSEPEYWIICSNEKDDQGEPLAWSNDLGWVAIEDATIFSNVEKETLRLPIGGWWEVYG